jgi:membrane protein
VNTKSWTSLVGHIDGIWLCAVAVWNEMLRTRAFVVAAALSFYFLLSLIPLLFVFSSLLAYLPVADVSDRLLDLLATFVPSEAMEFVSKAVGSVLTPHGGGVLSLSILGYLWSASGGFSAMIEALDIAYNVEISRPWWKDRLQALLLTLTTGALFYASLLLLIAGSSFGRLLMNASLVPAAFAHIWPTIRLILTFATFLAAMLVLYVLGPNTKITIRSALPGALLAIAGWLAGSFGLTFYLQHFANYDLTYGSLGAVVVLMLWFYIIAIAMLIGAEVNAQLAKRRAIGSPGIVLGAGKAESVEAAR